MTSEAKPEEPPILDICIRCGCVVEVTEEFKCGYRNFMCGRCNQIIDVDYDLDDYDDQ